MRLNLAFVKVVRARGKEYLYFDTGAKKNGRPVLKRLPDRGDPMLGTMHAAYLGVRTKRANIKSDMTLPDLAGKYERSPEFKKLSTGTQITYGVYVRQIVHLFASAPAKSVERRDVYELIDSMAKRPAAANMILLVLRNVYTWGIKREYVDHNPTTGVSMFDGGEYEPWPEDLVALALASDDPQVRLPVALLYYTAQRIGDVTKMRWSDVRDGVLYVTQQKTRKEMQITLHAALATVLASTPKRGPMILTDPNGKPSKPQAVRVRLQVWAKDNGHKVVPHGLRKNAVNALLEAGCSVAETSAMSGQSLKMVEHYSKLRSGKRLSSAAILKWENAR